MRKVAVTYTAEIDDDTYDRLVRRAEELGYDRPNHLTLVACLLKEHGLSEVGRIREQDRLCPSCGAPLEEFGIGEPPHAECTSCGHKQS